MSIQLLYLLAVKVLATVIYGTENRTVFWRTNEVRLISTSVGDATHMTPEQCLGFFLQIEKCIFFNVYSGNSTTPRRCEFFNTDRCSIGAKLVADETASFFDGNSESV